MTESLLIVPLEAISRIRSADVNYGSLGLLRDAPEGLWVVKSVQAGSGSMLPVDIPKGQAALLRGTPCRAGHWASVSADLHVNHYLTAHRLGTAIPYDSFRQTCPRMPDPGRGTGLLLTYAPHLPKELADEGVPEIAGWHVRRAGVTPCAIAVEPENVGLSQLNEHWPVGVLAKQSILIVGLGSIGGSIALRLASYGVGRLDLLDPDRLLWHNTVRHVLGPRDVGRLKVDAMAETLTARWPDLQVNRHPIDVVTDAQHVRALLPGVDLVVCAADGVAPRRVVSHLARRAQTTAILACVLDNGAVGEILRLRPGKNFGCLLCQRAALIVQGGIDPEASQEADYGRGSVHRPMTAVGADLDFVGAFAAKVAVATLLESANGDYDQRLPGEQAIIALRPKPGLAAPYDVAPAGMVAWHPATPPRPACPTCSPA